MLAPVTISFRLIASMVCTRNIQQVVKNLYLMFSSSPLHIFVQLLTVSLSTAADTSYYISRIKPRLRSHTAAPKICHRNNVKTKNSLDFLCELKKVEKKQHQVMNYSDQERSFPLKSIQTT